MSVIGTEVVQGVYVLVYKIIRDPTSFQNQVYHYIKVKANDRPLYV